MATEPERSNEELLRLGQLGLDLGYWEQAEAYYDAVLERMPSHVSALIGKAQACQDAARSLELVRLVLTWQPDHARARELESRYMVQVQQAARIALARQVPPARSRPDRATTKPWYRHSWAVVVAVAACLVSVLLITLLSLDPFPVNLRSMAPTRPLAVTSTMPVAQPTSTLNAQPLHASPSATMGVMPSAQRATVLIIVPQDPDNNLSRGSGCIVSKDGLVLTNYHVVSNASQTRLANRDGLVYVGAARDVRYPPDEWYIAAVVAMDPLRDLAALRVLSTAYGEPVAKPFEALELGDSETLALGQGLIGLGYPTLGGETLTLTKGSMAGFSTSENGVMLGKTDSELLPGSSGGAVLDADSRLVGIITAAYADERTLGRLSYFLLVQETHGLIAQGTRAALPSTDRAAWMVSLFRESVQN